MGSDMTGTPDVVLLPLNTNFNFELPFLLIDNIDSPPAILQHHKVPMPEGHSERLKVELMRLPVELVEMVVVEAVGVVGLPKASELRVVNEIFDRVIVKDLVEGDETGFKSDSEGSSFLRSGRPKKSLETRDIDESQLVANSLESVDTSWSGIIKLFDVPDDKAKRFTNGAPGPDISHGATVIAAFLNDASTVQKLIAQGPPTSSSISYPSTMLWVKQKPYSHFATAFKAAATTGAYDAALYQSENGHRGDPVSALWIASLMGHDDIVKLILDLKYDPNPQKMFREKYLATTIEGALRGRHLELVDQLWRNTRNQSIKWARMTLNLAAEIGVLPVVEELVDLGTDFIKPSIGSSFVKFFTQKGAANGKDGHGWALHEAACFGLVSSEKREYVVRMQQKLAKQG
ncbi:uncharacterized protein PAC_14079 [Phialocephala subalpina]|uniref:Ankyrin n=1 Tax=Phialocephala subalpina TaxID=576137 RepID=A0A1L7XGN7_9HELO|nr:uncharacterized protein PAC_14079 [Phialocephala subalpina]